MGCTSSVSPLHRRSDKTDIKIPFPLSYYQKCVIKDTWGKVNESSTLEFGVGVFYSLFKKKPELKKLFPEFQSLEDIEELKKWTFLIGHPMKLCRAFDEAIESLDDGDLFISKMEQLGEKHLENQLQPEYLNAVGEAVLLTLESILGEDEWNPDVKRAWRDMYNFVCKLMKIGLLRAMGRSLTEL